MNTQYTPIQRYNTPVNLMNLDEWKDQFEPVESGLTANLDDGWEGCLFSRKSDVIQAEKYLNPNKVWTVLREGGKLVIVEGYRGVSHTMGYLLTKNAFPALQRTVVYAN